jgi:hypothetical protein
LNFFKLWFKRKWDENDLYFIGSSGVKESWFQGQQVIKDMLFRIHIWLGLLRNRFNMNPMIAKDCIKVFWVMYEMTFDVVIDINCHDLFQLYWGYVGIFLFNVII